MLELVEDAGAKGDAQAKLRRRLQELLPNQGTKSIGYRGGKHPVTVFAAGPNGLWVAFDKVSRPDTIERFWTPAGVFDASRHAQNITVELNVPSKSNDARVAGFFARDAATGRIFLMHSGRVGGGRKGIGRDAFLEWSRLSLVSIVGDGGRRGIEILNLDDADPVARIWAFVKLVDAFKAQAAGAAMPVSVSNSGVEP